VALPPFELHRPRDIAEAAELLSQFGDDGAFYMGGTELLLLMKLGFASPGHLIDGKGIAELKTLSITSAAATIGAGVTHRRLERHPDLRRALPTFSRMESLVANIRVRNVGTIGGNLCFAEPHSDPATLMAALDADVTLVSPAGERTVPLTEFSKDAFVTDLRPGEIMVRINLPLPDPATRIGYERLAFKERPDAAAAVVLKDGSYRVVVGAVSGRPTRVLQAEQALQESGGRDVAAAVEATNATIAAADRMDGGDYRAHLAGVLVGRACRSAVASGALA
jgi:carbon-monoxide dehydrogenase medium subunit